MAVNASTQGGNQRLKTKENTSKRGCMRNHKRFYVEERIFKLWLQAKFDAGYESFSDSDFATHLLSLEYRRR